MIKRLTFIIIFVFHSAIGLTCERGIVTIDSGSFVNSVVFTDTNTQFTNDITVNHAAPSTNCLFYGTFDYGIGGSFNNRVMEYNGNTIPYNVHRNNSTGSNAILRYLSDIGNNNHILRGRFRPNRDTVDLTYTAVLGTVPSGLPPGFYTDALAFVVATDDGNPDQNFWRPVAERAVSFSYYIPSRTDLYIVPNGAGIPTNMDMTESVDFGELQTGDSVDLDFIIDTNVGYQIQLESTNSGVLNNAIAGQSVPYVINSGTFSGQLLAPQIVSTNAGTGIFTVDFNATVGSVGSNPAAGFYSDTIYVIVSAF